MLTIHAVASALAALSFAVRASEWCSLRQTFVVRIVRDPGGHHDFGRRLGLMANAHLAELRAGKATVIEAVPRAAEVVAFRR